MRALYVLQVLLVSVEALVLTIAWFMWTEFDSELHKFANSIALNDDALKYLTLLPVTLAVWIIKEARLLLQEDNETIGILTSWPDYWRLKTHTWVSLFYAVVFAGLSVIPWVVKAGISSSTGLLVFVASIAGQLSLAGSVYAARIRVKEIIAQARKP